VPINKKTGISPGIPNPWCAPSELKVT